MSVIKNIIFQNPLTVSVRGTQETAAYKVGGRDVDILLNQEVDYFSHGNSHLVPLNQTTLAGVYNVWASVNGNGADLRLDLCLANGMVAIGIFDVSGDKWSNRDQWDGEVEENNVIGLFPPTAEGLKEADLFFDEVLKDM